MSQFIRPTQSHSYSILTLNAEGEETGFMSAGATVEEAQALVQTMSQQPWNIREGNTFRVVKQTTTTAYEFIG